MNFSCFGGNITKNIRSRQIYYKNKTINILVLGFYDRGNLGDESYKYTITMLLDRLNTKQNTKCIFKCTDDIDFIPDNIDIVICGGGDIINKYFMEKVKNIINYSNYTKPIYALSVGIPHNEVKYLDIFDHIFTRSMIDYEKAVNMIGSKNVSYIPDLAFLLRVKPKLEVKTIDEINIGICLAQPVFVNNDNLLEQIISLINKLLDRKNVKLHFFAFNTNNINNKESDIFLINKILSYLNQSQSQNLTARCIVHDTTNIELMLNNIEKMDINLCMRYHSVIFSIITKVPFIPLYNSSKIENILKDINYDEKYKIKIDETSNIEPKLCDKIIHHIYAKLNDKKIINMTNIYNVIYFENILNIINAKKLQNVLIKSKKYSIDEAINNLKKLLDNYFESGYLNDTVLMKPGPLNLKDKDSLKVARIITYAITNSMNNECVWGLKENLTRADFILFESIKYIFEKNKEIEKEIAEKYYPVLTVKRKCYVNVDPYIDNNSYDNIHRSGWQYVIGFLQNINTKMHRNNEILLDTYIDRTFHWGYDIMNAADCLPYKTPWIGFIHHTFDTTHSEYNCINLFKNEKFIESLKTCKGIIVLSNYLAKQVRAYLNNTCNIHINVYVIYHPTEFVENNFTFNKFINNNDKKVIQIGAWLRKPFSIYKLQINNKNNKFNLRKAALKGKNMNAYFKPNTLLNDFKTKICIENSEIYNCDNAYPTTENIKTPNKIVNKYIEGVYDYLGECDRSVDIIERLNNDEYDELLSKNIVFLDLIDCSAVNTVIECVVRNTILIINRHPAIEEIVGVNYPGFYDNLFDVTNMLSNTKYLEKIYNYLYKLDKTKLKIETFMDDLQIIADTCINT